MWVTVVIDMMNCDAVSDGSALVSFTCKLQLGIKLGLKYGSLVVSSKLGVSSIFLYSFDTPLGPLLIINNNNTCHKIWADGKTCTATACSTTLHAQSRGLFAVGISCLVFM